MKQNRYATYKKVLAVSLSVIFFCIFLFSIISIAMDAPQDAIAALAGKIGGLKGVSVKTAYSSVISKE